MVVLRALGQRAVPARRVMSTFSSPVFSSYLVSPRELHDALERHRPSKLSTAPRIVPLCGSWFLPNDPDGRTGRSVFAESRIPGARFFDLDKACDKASPYPHMLPSAADFASVMGAVGIHPDDEVVVYDTKELGIFSAPRVAWTLRVFGHRGVYILNNYKRWVAEGLPTETGEPAAFERSAYPEPVEVGDGRVVDFTELRESVLEQNKEGAQQIQILDARSRGRWEGTAPEPRPGLSSGHIPGSVSIPFDTVLDRDHRAFLPPEQLSKVFEEKGVSRDRPIISSCGTGVTAVVLDTALEAAGWGPDRQVYDGSWTEWAQRVQPGENLIRKI